MPSITSAVSSGATRVTKVLTAVNQEATIWCEGQAKVGISIRTVTGTPTLSFFGSTDGVQFNPLGVGAYPSATPPSSVVTTATAAGSYEVNVQNYKFIRVQITSGAGPATIVMTASVDGSYQEAFANAAQGTSLAVMYPSTTSSSGVNTMAIPALANAAVNLTFLEVNMVGPGMGGNAHLRIWDGAVGTGVPLYQCLLTGPTGSTGVSQLINLPTDAEGNKELTNTPGNALVIQIINLGNVFAIMNSRYTYK